MALPQMPNIPGAAVMTDTLDFVKNLWGSMGVVPGIAAPTLSVEELDKKINDLKAVEAWLNLNSSMVRGSIQALEVQRNTIATLKSMGKSMAAAVQQSGDKDKDTKSLFESIPYASAFFQHAAEALQPGAPGPAPKEAKTEAKAEPKPEPVLKPAAQPAQEAPPAAPAAAPANSGAAPAQAPAGANDAMAAAGMANPSVWWNLLQEQFKQAVSGAMSAEAMTGAAARATEAATKFAQAATQAATKPLSKAAAAAQAAAAGAQAGNDEEPAKKAARKPAARKAAKPAAK